MIQKFIENILTQNSECDNIKSLSTRAENVSSLITKRNLVVRVDFNHPISVPTIRFSPTIYTRGLLPYKNPPLSWMASNTFKKKTTVPLDITSYDNWHDISLQTTESAFESPIQFLVDWAQKYGAYEGYFVYSRESDPWVIAFNIKKNQWIRDEERIDKVKNLESKLKSIKSNKDNIEGFLEKPDHIHNDYEGYRNLVTYYNIEIEKVTEKIKTHKRLLGMNIFRI